MALIAGGSVDHPAPGLLQLPGPGDVVALVKAGPQLHQHRHGLAVLRRGAQVLDDGGLPRHPVNGHLNGHHRRVRGALAQ